MQRGYEQPFLQSENCLGHTDKHTGWYQPGNFLHGNIALVSGMLKCSFPLGMDVCARACPHAWGLHLIDGIHRHKIFIAIQRHWESQRLAFGLADFIIITGSLEQFASNFLFVEEKGVISFHITAVFKLIAILSLSHLLSLLLTCTRVCTCAHTLAFSLSSWLCVLLSGRPGQTGSLRLELFQAENEFPFLS